MTGQSATTAIPIAATAVSASRDERQQQLERAQLERNHCSAVVWVSKAIKALSLLPTPAKRQRSPMGACSGGRAICEYTGAHECMHTCETSHTLNPAFIHVQRGCMHIMHVKEDARQWHELVACGPPCMMRRSTRPATRARSRACRPLPLAANVIMAGQGPRWVPRGVEPWVWEVFLAVAGLTRGGRYTKEQAVKFLNELDVPFEVRAASGRPFLSGAVLSAPADLIAPLFGPDQDPDADLRGAEPAGGPAGEAAGGRGGGAVAAAGISDEVGDGTRGNVGCYMPADQGSVIVSCLKGSCPISFP